MTGVGHKEENLDTGTHSESMVPCQVTAEGRGQVPAEFSGV